MGKRVGIRTKLFNVFFIIIAFIVVISGTGIYNVIKVSNETKEIETNQKIMKYYNDMAFHMVRSNAAIRGYMSLQKPFMRENHYEIRKQVHESMKKIKEMNAETEEFKKFEAQYIAWENDIDTKVFPLIDQGKMNEALLVSAPILGDGSKELVEYSKKIANEKDKQIETMLVDVNNTGKKALTVMLTVALLSIIVSIFVSSWLGNKFVRLIQNVVLSATRFAKGDFTTRVKIESNDELGDLGKSINHMAEELQSVMTNIIESSNQVSSTSHLLEGSSHEVSLATEQITSSIVDISSNMEHQAKETDEIKKRADTISNEMETIEENIEFVHQYSQDAVDLSSQGKTAIDNITNQIDTIVTHSNQVADAVDKLSNQSSQINETILLITTIADQTNLLALNASIEAARAGEHGKGFAVVADEVRKLAEESREAAEKIKTMIEKTVSDTKQVANAMKEGNQAVVEGKKLVDDTKVAFLNINTSINHVSQKMGTTRDSIEQIYKQMMKLIDDVHQITQISEQISGDTHEIVASAEEQTASLEEVAAAAAQLAQMSTQLKTSLHVFKF